MAFTKTDKYWANKIKMELEAIVGTREALTDVTIQGDTRAIEANSRQIDFYFSSVKKSIADYEKWMTK